VASKITKRRKILRIGVDMESEVVVYVVLEEDRGLGPMVVGVYRSREDADRAVGGSSHCWVVEEVLQ